MRKREIEHPQLQSVLLQSRLQKIPAWIPFQLVIYLGRHMSVYFFTGMLSLQKTLLTGQEGVELKVWLLNLRKGDLSSSVHTTVKVAAGRKGEF